MKEKDSKLCQVLYKKIDEKKIFLTSDVYFNNIFINSFINKRIDKTKSYIIFYDEKINLTNVKYKQNNPNSKVKTGNGNCLSYLIEQSLVPEYEIPVHDDLNVIVISSRNNFYNINFEIKEDISVNINFLFINLTFNARSIAKIRKNIRENSTAIFSWNSINCINKEYKDYNPESKDNKKNSQVLFSNSIFISDTTYLKKNSSIYETYNLGFVLDNVILDKYFFSEEINSYIETKYLAFPVDSYILRENHHSFQGKAKSIFRGFYTKEFKQKDLNPDIDVEFFSDIKDEKNQVLQDIKLVCELPCSVSVKPNILAQGEKQEGDHGYTQKNNFFDEESFFFLNIFGIKKSIIKLVLLTSLALDTYEGDFYSFFKEYLERYNFLNE